MIRALYDWTLRLADHRYALWVLAAVSFIESSFFPIPPDILLIPMVLAAPHRAWLIAGVCTVSSVLGGLFGYWIGAEFMELIGRPVLDFYGKGPLFEDFARRYEEAGPWAVLFAGLTPFPYKIITIASGATGLDLATFMISSVIARGLRFFIVAALLWKFGEPIREFIERRLGWLFTLAVVLLIGGFAMVRFL
ncbi:YqaA family protein [Pontivivens insulae]|uniref:VTT domain-containing protein n=1 Tax=Pontivivens insulae TaxID=1639689 RepID=A0A2R8ACH4_9RHOB|nr:YqaA family protein [Pontivivens insulae]RED11087.1 membrane protein YqaA with SNARE-associated domain [Pontivivens insulae]SPF29738.1 hypothetical protein POI8812_02055 [Pontivivens insulae]